MSRLNGDLQKEQERRVEHALNRDPTVKFMMEKMEEVRFRLNCTMLIQENGRNTYVFRAEVQKKTLKNPWDNATATLCQCKQAPYVQAGCKVGRQFFKVEECSNLDVGGGFSPQGDGVSTVIYGSSIPPEMWFYVQTPNWFACGSASRGRGGAQ